MAFNWDKITGDNKQFIKSPLAWIMFMVLIEDTFTQATTTNNTININL